MYQETSPDYEERMALNLRIVNMEGTLQNLEHEKANMQQTYLQEIANLKQENNVLKLSLHSAEEKNALLQARLNTTGYAMVNPPLLDSGKNRNAPADDNKLTAAVNNEIDVINLDGSDNDSESDYVLSPEAHVPTAWIVFSNHIKMLRLRLSIFPLLALRHKKHGPELQDLVTVRCTRSDTYYVSKAVVRSALERSTTYLEYATSVFDDLFEPEVAAHCMSDGSNHGDCSDGYLRATLPREALNVFLDHCSSVANHSFRESPVHEHVLRACLTQRINMHLEEIRAKQNLGPSPKEFACYRAAMRLHVLRMQKH